MIEAVDRAAEELPDGGFDVNALVGDQNAWLWFGVVDDAWRGRGLICRLFEARLQWARGQDADMVFAFEREHDSRASHHLFEANEFVPIERLE